MYLPKTHEEELLLEALIKNTCFDEPFPTRAEGYTASITRDTDQVWDSRGRLKAILEITSPSSDYLMDGTTLPIYLWVEIADRVIIWWYLPPNAWINDRHGISERWPVMPGPFLWKPV